MNEPKENQTSQATITCGHLTVCDCQKEIDLLREELNRVRVENEALKETLATELRDSDWITTPCTHDKMPHVGDRIVYEFEPADGYTDWNVWKIESERPFLIWDVVLRFKIIERAK